MAVKKNTQAQALGRGILGSSKKKAQTLETGLGSVALALDSSLFNHPHPHPSSPQSPLRNTEQVSPNRTNLPRPTFLSPLASTPRYV